MKIFQKHVSPKCPERDIESTPTSSRFRFRIRVTSPVIITNFYPENNGI